MMSRSHFRFCSFGNQLRLQHDDAVLGTVRLASKLLGRHPSTVAVELVVQESAAVGTRRSLTVLFTHAADVRTPKPSTVKRVLGTVASLPKVCFAAPYKMSDTRRPRVVEAPARRAPAKLEAIRVVVEYDPNPDVSYLEQEEFEERLAAYKNEEFSFLGVHAEADVTIEGVVQTLTSGGLWGIESDSGDEYIEEVAVQEYEELRKILKTIGVPTADLPLEMDPAWRTS